LLVDDEINILEGIAKIVDWNGSNAILAGKAYHGQMAFELVSNDPPDIVITDIKMPGLNGVELIEKVLRFHPKVKFIILSGHDEFEFAKTAMKYGVKHYLLKPSNRRKIEEALQEVIVELEQENIRKEFIKNIKANFNKVIPIAKKQFLSEYIVNKSFGMREWDYYQQLFEMQPIHGKVRLIVMVIDDHHDFKQLFALKEIMLGLVNQGMIVHLSTTIGEKAVLLIEDQLLEVLLAKIEEAKGLFSEYYHMKFTTTISNPAKIEQIQRLYKEANDCLTQRFYLGNGSIITMNDLRKYQTNFENIQFDHGKITFALRSGNQQQVQYYLDEFFDEIKRANFEVTVVKSHCLELLMSIIRQAKSEDIEMFLAQITHFQEFETLEEIKTFVEQLSEELALQNYDETRQTQHNIIQKVIHYLKDNISDELLSLSQIADHVVYMNPDYLGRLFKKELGKNFSTYLIELRIEKAIGLMRQSNTVKVFEIANRVGFGNNPRYFGQVFKKHIGVTPTEYKQGVMD
jgi:two-component system response regulator YesN